jgi:hypothetical protein
MSAKPEPESTELPLPLSVLDEIDQICDRFEGAWGRGEAPRMEDYLGAVAEPDRPTLLRELLAADLNARRRRGERPTPADYAARCPEHARRILDLFPAVEPSERLNPLYFLHGFVLESCSKARSPMSTSCELWFCTTARTWSTTRGPTATAGDDPADLLTTCVRIADVLV